ELGDVYIENVTIPVPADAIPGKYHLEIGLFDSVNPRTYSFFKDGTPVPVHRIDVLLEAETD
ncbi:MAG TPA: hypothetical protein VF434_10675, partial [Promineifilum sp.]